MARAACIHGEGESAAADPPADDPLALSKVCELEDFSHPHLRPILSALKGIDCPTAADAGDRLHVERKQWEMAMAIKALDELGALRLDAEILGVGAGGETTTFLLTTRVRRVFATDLYAAPGEWEITANAGMLMNPYPPAPIEWNPRRLVVQHMDALDLRYEDNSFDGIYSSSSIEHFGSHHDVRRSIEEMHRVLKPGGVLTVATELRLSGPGEGLRGTLLFSLEELSALFGGLAWVADVELSLSQSEATRRVVVPFEEAMNDVLSGSPTWSTYPHLVLAHEGYVWTSVHVALVKA